MRTARGLFLAISSVFLTVAVHAAALPLEWLHLRMRMRFVDWLVKKCGKDGKLDRSHVAVGRETMTKKIYPLPLSTTYVI